MDNAVMMAPALGIVALCAALCLSRATFYRRRDKARAGTASAQQAPCVSPQVECLPKESSVGAGPDLDPVQAEPSATAPPAELVIDAGPRAAQHGAEADAPASAPTPPVSCTALNRTSPRALSDEERARVLSVLDQERFCNLAPAQVYATLLDEGTYLCSERTMYRILDENQQVRERRNQLRHPSYAAPELMAKAPNQLWSWDITKLKTFVKSQYLHLYVILDVFSRYVVGWMVAPNESGELAEALIDESCKRQGITPGQLTFHADNGSAMVSQPVAFLLASLGITKSHSRPHVSDDNPFSEAQFKTLKYRPDFPERFASLEHARTFLSDFFIWYNTQHHHVSLALLTPHDVHHGQVTERLAQRALVLNAAYAAHPERFVHRAPAPATPPETVWINPPKTPAPTQEVQA